MSQWLRLQAPIVAGCFGTRPFAMRHHLAEHALFELPRLIGLARDLPAASVEYNAGDLPLTVDPARTPRNGLSAAETLQRIESCRSWMVLKNVEQDPAYRRLLEACLAEVQPLCPPGHERMLDLEAFVFVSSPGAVTPYHMDPEQNFLLQIRGEKTMQVFDRGVLGELELERFHSGGHRNLVYRDACAAHAEAFTLRPGMGLHVPACAPHWVQNGAAVSVSFSITFRTPALLRRAHVHACNAQLRRLGLLPSPAGQSAWRDSAKQWGYRIGSRLQRLAHELHWRRPAAAAGTTTPATAGGA